MDALDKMTRWCQENALKSLDDKSDTLHVMEDAYLANKSGNNDVLLEESIEYDKNDVNEQLDYMVLELSRRFGNNIVFKGGYMLTKLIGSRARQTYDIDFSIASKEIYAEIKLVLLDIANYFKSAGIIDEFKIKETVEQTMTGGVDFYKDGIKVLSADIGLHDISYGTVVKSINIGDVNSFSVERMLADKITAILSRKRFRRPKDIYDLYCISDCLDFDARLASEFIIRRTNGIGADWQNFPFSIEVITEYRRAYESLQLTSIYKDRNLQKPDFEVVYKRFCDIALKVRDINYETKWDHCSHCFR